jgi:hypothetical protein
VGTKFKVNDYDGQRLLLKAMLSADLEDAAGKPRTLNPEPLTLILKPATLHFETKIMNPLRGPRGRSRP